MVWALATVVGGGMGGGGGDSSVHHCIFVICNIVDCMMTLCLYNCEHGSSTCLFQ